MGIFRKKWKSERQYAIVEGHRIPKISGGDPDKVAMLFIGIIVAVIFVLVLISVTAGVLGPLKTQLTKYAANDTVFGSTVQSVAPLLVGAAVLIGITIGLLVHIVMRELG